MFLIPRSQDECVIFWSNLDTRSQKFVCSAACFSLNDTVNTWLCCCSHFVFGVSQSSSWPWNCRESYPFSSWRVFPGDRTEPRRNTRTKRTPAESDRRKGKILINYARDISFPTCCLLLLLTIFTPHTHSLPPAGLDWTLWTKCKHNHTQQNVTHDFSFFVASLAVILYLQSFLLFCSAVLGNFNLSSASDDVMMVWSVLSSISN